MSFAGADGKALAAYIDALVLKKAYDKAVLSSKEVEVDNDDLDLDELFEPPDGLDREKVPEQDIINIIISELFFIPDNTDKLIRDDDDRIDDSNLFNPNNL